MWNGFATMAAVWMLVLVMLAAVNAAEYENDRRPCASVQVSSSVVTVGSPVTATCIISDHCPAFSGEVEWRLGNRVFPGGVPVTNEYGRAYRVTIPAFNQSRATLTCCLRATPSQIIAGVQIRAGYPPQAPKNLSCQANLSTHESLTCKWETSLQDSHLPTNYTLHTYIGDLKLNHTYKLPQGVRSITIPRSGFVFFSEMEIYLRAVNPLGETRSARLTLEPVSSAKFDRPKIVKLQSWRLGCLRLKWDFSQDQDWMKDLVSLEVRLKTETSNLWSEWPVLDQATPRRPVYRCGLLHATQYITQIRVRYQQSPWSEWSNSQSAVTMETAPTGTLDTWMRVTGNLTHNQLKMLLFWKPSERFRANSRNVSYVVSALKTLRGKLCATARNHCTFHVPRKARKVYIVARNAAGMSTPTSIRIYHPKAASAISVVSATAAGNRSLLVRWENVASPNLIDYIVEWRPLLNNNLSLVHFETARWDLSSLVVTDSFEPYKPYGISVYPRFKDGIGPPRTVNTYLLQKAPSVVPEIKIRKNWQYHVELTWDEIPLDQRNGIIQGYKLFYWDETKRVHVAHGDLEERKVVLTGLNSMSVYDAVLMVSTHGGSQNGSMVHFDIKEWDPVSSMIIAVTTCASLCLATIFVVKICFSKHNQLKMRFWPDVPDPANSSIKSWTSESTHLDIRSSWDFEEPNPIYLSHLSFLEIPQKPNKKEDVTAWLNNAEDTSDLGESICGSPLIPSFTSSNSDSVPYATVIFPATHPHEYLRSESTQPLLESEGSQSPKCYQNVDASEDVQCFFGPCEPKEEDNAATIQWEDFPFLRALAMNDTQ